MTDRFGNLRATKIRAAWNDLREAIRERDLERAEEVFDRLEQWAEYFWSKAPTPPTGDTP